MLSPLPGAPWSESLVHMTRTYANRAQLRLEGCVVAVDEANQSPDLVQHRNTFPGCHTLGLPWTTPTVICNAAALALALVQRHADLVS
jgi:hypothetical protein